MYVCMYVCLHACMHVCNLCMQYVWVYFMHAVCMYVGLLSCVISSSYLCNQEPKVAFIHEKTWPSQGNDQEFRCADLVAWLCSFWPELAVYLLCVWSSWGNKDRR